MAHHALVSDWYAMNKLKELMEFAETGDLLEFDRGLYSHWGVFAGLRYVKGKKIACVFHFASPGDTTSFDVVCRSRCCRKREFGLGNISMDSLVDIALESSVRINNGTDTKWEPGEVDEILARAEIRAVEDEEYDMFTNNCEHFAHFCRYGRKESRQVQNATTAGGVVLGVAVVFLAGVAIASMSNRPARGRRNQ